LSGAGTSAGTIEFEPRSSNGVVARVTGDGLCFNGDTASANALDDYEEGTWTAAFAVSTSGSITTSSSYNTGYYTKIGNKVFYNLHIRPSAISSPVGSLNITGLPFTSSSDSKKRNPSSIVNAWSSNLPSGSSFMALIGNTATKINVGALTGGANSPVASYITIQTEFYIQGFYEL